LTNATLSYGLEIADHGIIQALRENAALSKGLNTYQGSVTHEGVATAFGLKTRSVEEVLQG
jgi:alanine dehydrogenase